MALKPRPVDIETFRAIGKDIAQFYEPLGKHSKLFHYCNKAIKQGRFKFVLVCIEDAGGTVAFDVSTQDPESLLDMREIRSWYYARRGYWRRLLPKKTKVSPVTVSRHLASDCQY
jgi:hypothetical protein